MPFDPEKRTHEISLFVSEFIELVSKDSNGELIFIPDAASIVTDLYEQLINIAIRPFLNGYANIHRFKVVSGLELATIQVSPIHHEDHATKIRFNAIFANGLAFTFLVGISYGLKFSAESFKPFPSAVEDLINQHITWLEYRRTDNDVSYPVFLNANYWQSISTFLELGRIKSKEDEPFQIV